MESVQTRGRCPDSRTPSRADVQFSDLHDRLATRQHLLDARMTDTNAITRQLCSFEVAETTLQPGRAVGSLLCRSVLEQYNPEQMLPAV